MAHGVLGQLPSSDSPTLNRSARPPKPLSARVWRELARVLAAANAAKVTTIAMVIGIVISGRIALLQLGCLGHAIHPQEGHYWRQAFTYSVAWNFAHDSPNFFLPRSFHELAKSNIVAMEAPIYPYLSSAFLRVFGDGVLPMRLISWLFLVAIAFVILAWFGEGRARRRDAWCDRAGLLIALGVSPAIAVEFRSVQPEPMAAGLAVLSAFYFSRYAGGGQRRALVIGGILAALAVLTKPVALGVLPGIAILGTYGKGRWLRRGITVSAVLAVALVPQFLWDRWAQHLLLDEMNGNLIISIQHNPNEMLRNVQNLTYIREAALHLVPNYAGSWWLVPAMLAGLYRGLADSRLRRLALGMLVWMLGYLVELVAFGDRLQANAYYCICALPPVALFSALGIGGLVGALDSPTWRPSLTTIRTALVAFLLPAGLLLSNKIDWSSTEHPALALGRNRAVWTSDLGLTLLLVGIVVALALAATVRPPRIPSWVGVPALSVVLFSSYWASQDAVQYFRYYEASKVRRTYTGDLAALRGAVARHSRPSDRIVSSPANILSFYQGLRNGFSSDEVQTPAQLTRVQGRGARLWIETLPDSNPPFGRLLERGEYFRLYCIAEDDCR